MHKGPYGNLLDANGYPIAWIRDGKLLVGSEKRLVALVDNDGTVRHPETKEVVCHIGLESGDGGHSLPEALKSLLG